MNFSISLLSIFNRTIGLNILGELYKVLVGLGIMMELDILKCNSQCPKLMYILEMLMKILRHKQLLTMILRCLYNSLLGFRVNELLHLKITLLNSSLENGIYIVTALFGISSNNSKLIWWLWDKLNNKWSACQRSSSSR